jgi:hypothetical protein
MGAVNEAMAKYKLALSIDEGHVDTLNSIALLCEFMRVCLLYACRCMYVCVHVQVHDYT